MRSDSGSVGQEGLSFIAEARREQIKKAAIDTIVELGYAKASLAQIAKRAGISKGVISYHFAGKDELMEKLVVEFYVAGAHFMLPHLEAETTARGVLLRYIEKNISYIVETGTRSSPSATSSSTSAMPTAVCTSATTAGTSSSRRSPRSCGRARRKASSATSTRS